MMVHPGAPSEGGNRQQYAPHPGEMSGETWPMSMAEMTEELLRTRNRSRHASLIHSSAYDNSAEAAAGAAALVNASRVPNPARGQAPPQQQHRFSQQPTPALASPPLGEGRAPPAPAMASMPMPAVYAQPQRETARRSQAPPLRLPMSPYLADDVELPSVVLTPPGEFFDAHRRQNSTDNE